MAQTVQDALRRVFYFRGLSPEQLEEMAAIAAIRSYEAGEFVFGEGETATAFYIILEGKVQIYKISSEGKEMILHLFGAGEIFAEVPIFSGIPRYPANALCTESARLIIIQGAGFQSLVMRHPEIGMNMLSVFAKRLHEFSELIEDLSLRSVDSRLAKYLISVSENSPESAIIHIQKRTLAAILGTIPETLSRSFKKLSNDGLIRVSGNHIHLLNREQLALVADIENTGSP